MQQDREVRPAISVIVASLDTGDDVVRCLKAIEASANQRQAEIIVVDNSNDGNKENVRRQFPKLSFVRCCKGTLIPQLWEAGINCSHGEIVALTTAHFIPAENWIAEILRAHQGTYAGIGGAIENDSRGGLVSWAVYFCRYSRYMLRFSPHEVDDFAADNSSYKRWALEACRATRRDGFWETFVHTELRRTGAKLFLTPDIVVYHQRSFTSADFIRQRFQHGRHFGSERVRNASSLCRLGLLLMSPGIPFLLLWRITRRVISQRRHFGRYVLTLPILSLFLLSWSLGELTGYMSPRWNAGKA